MNEGRRISFSVAFYVVRAARENFFSVFNLELILGENFFGQFKFSCSTLFLVQENPKPVAASENCVFLLF